MSAKVRDLMIERVHTAAPGDTVAAVRALMHDHHVHAVPVVGDDGAPVGLVSASDLLNGAPPDLPVSAIMATEVVTVPPYADVSRAARMMRNRHIHHLVVTHEGRIVGILSTYDLLKVVEEHQFVPKNRAKAPGRPRAPRFRKQGRIRGEG